MEQTNQEFKFARWIALIIFAFALAMTPIVIASCVSPQSNESETPMSLEVRVEETTPPADLNETEYLYDVSYEEKVLMAKVVWAEARGECFEGKVAVAAVILNRFNFKENSWDFENESISSVIFQRRQFADISNVTMQNLEEYPDCMEAVEVACKGFDPTREVFKQGALYFYSPKLVTGKEKEIREGIKVMVIGNHNFHYDFEKVVED